MTAACVLILASLVLLYAMVGYPLLLATVVRRVAPEIRKNNEFRPTVTVILAVHNGEEFIHAKLESLLGLDYPAALTDILVVSDGSTDATDAIVSSFASRGVRLLRAPHGGKAAALNLGIGHASGEILFFTDVRQVIHPAALSHLVANLADPSVGAVTGELRMLNPNRSGEQADMELYWRYELWARRCHSRIDSVFTATGCIYAMRRSLAEPIPPDTLSDDALIPLGAFFRGYRVVFDPASVAFDYPAVEGMEFRRRLRTLAGLWQLYIRLPRLFTRANRMRFHFLSHKFIRLLLPWATLASLAATVALPDSAPRTFLLLDELVLILLAVIDPSIPGRFPLKRISSPAKTFLSMNLAALLAPAVFLIPARTLWRPVRVQSE
jgi:cellulose synthase/poly-beta-1,6-N-acetylglucosamine synthase-like glycosyltransferase